MCKVAPVFPFFFFLRDGLLPTSSHTNTFNRAVNVWRPHFTVLHYDGDGKHWALVLPYSYVISLASFILLKPISLARPTSSTGEEEETRSWFAAAPPTLLCQGRLLKQKEGRAREGHRVYCMQPGWPHLSPAQFTPCFNA